MKRLMILLALASCTAGTSGESVEREDLRADLRLTNSLGEEVSLENDSDKYLFVNFWATWCRPCITELPSIEALQDSLKSEPVKFILVTNETPEQTNNFLEKKGIQIPGYHMEDAVEAFGLIGFPTSLLISPEGELLMKVEGADDWNDSRNVNSIRALINESSTRE